MTLVFHANLLVRQGKATPPAFQIAEKFHLKKLIRVAEIGADDELVLTDFPLHEGPHEQRR